MTNVTGFLTRLLQEPPFRLFTKALIKRLPCSVRTKALWDVADRPNYLAGVLAGADQAIREGVKAISVYEFGVAGGNGLMALAEMAEVVEKETGVRIHVYGFDRGMGLPQPLEDFRDHPDQWIPGDYPMDISELRRRLKPNTTLIIGDIASTLPEHIRTKPDPAAFVSVDVDLYSAATDVLLMFQMPGKRMLRRTFMYFDDIDLPFNHRFAGELLAIDEFNASVGTVKIDRWRGIEKHRPFPDSAWLRRMYIAHDLEAISRVRLQRDVAFIRVDDTRWVTS